MSADGGSQTEFTGVQIRVDTDLTVDQVALRVCAMTFAASAPSPFPDAKSKRRTLALRADAGQRPGARPYSMFSAWALPASPA
jgi:hypothetical protein